MSQKHQDSKNNNRPYDEDFEQETDAEKLESLIKSLQKVNKQRQNGNKEPKPPKNRVVMIEFGGKFHPNLILNFMMYYVINLLVIYGVAVLFNLATFQGALWVPLSFVFVYTLGETLIRTYILYRHVKLAVQSFGLVFFISYLALFFMIDMYAFPNATKFATPTELVAFTGLFVLVRYLLALWVKKMKDWRGLRG